VANITLWKKNESIALVKCDDGIAHELSEYFSFFVPGYKYMKMYKIKVWDGKIRLFNLQTRELPAGLYPFVVEFCKRNNYTIETESNEFGSLLDTDKIKPKDLNEFIKSLNLQNNGQAIEVRDYQFDAIAKALDINRCVLLSPTGSGKSLIIYVLTQYYHAMLNDDRYPMKALIIVPTTSLVEQMYDDFKNYGLDVEKECHRIYSGRDKDNIQASIVISTWQSIYKLDVEWYEQFGIVIGDECHGFKSKSLTEIMTKCVNAKYRYGTTGTLDNAQVHHLVLQGLFGKIHRVTTTRKLQDNNTLADLDINILVLKYDESIRKAFGKPSYQDEIAWIVDNKARNNFIRNLAVDQKGNTLVLFNFVEKHGKPLYELIKDKAGDNRQVFYVSGEVETSDRESIRKIVEGQKNAIIVASLGTFSTGINIRNLHNIVFASPSKSQIKVLQSIGRGLRKSDNGQVTTLYDISDDLHYKGHQNYAMLHSIERVKIYKKEKFKFKLIEVPIHGHQTLQVDD
jgi:superfamily II DNA or RNA helicase